MTRIFGFLASLVALTGPLFVHATGFSPNSTIARRSHLTLASVPLPGADFSTLWYQNAKTHTTLLDQRLERQNLLQTLASSGQAVVRLAQAVESGEYEGGEEIGDRLRLLSLQVQSTELVLELHHKIVDAFSAEYLRSGNEFLALLHSVQKLDMHIPQREEVLSHLGEYFSKCLQIYIDGIGIHTEAISAIPEPVRQVSMNLAALQVLVATHHPGLSVKPDNVLMTILSFMDANQISNQDRQAMRVFGLWGDLLVSYLQANLPALRDAAQEAEELSATSKAARLPLKEQHDGVKAAMKPLRTAMKRAGVDPEADHVAELEALQARMERFLNALRA